jgi:hypothetical protein
MLPPDGYRLVFGLSNRQIGTLRVRNTCDGSPWPLPTTGLGDGEARQAVRALRWRR